MHRYPVFITVMWDVFPCMLRDVTIRYAFAKKPHGGHIVSRGKGCSLPSLDFRRPADSETAVAIRTYEVYLASGFLALELKGNVEPVFVTAGRTGVHFVLRLDASDTFFRTHLHNRSSTITTGVTKASSHAPWRTPLFQATIFYQCLTHPLIEKETAFALLLR
jgi:hypothetical protein